MIRGKAYIATTTGAQAYTEPQPSAAATLQGAIKPSRAVTMSPINGEAGRTRESGLLHYLRVLPEQPQGLVWLVPQVGIDYQIETSTDLKWAIK